MVIIGRNRQLSNLNQIFEPNLGFLIELQGQTFNSDGVSRRF